MFQSKIHPLIIPQHEHGRMAGMLAAIWGNGDFDRPSMGFDSFVKGVTFHDRGYGTFDNLPIGSMDEVGWIEVTQKGIEQRFDDPTADIVALMHLKRLLTGHQSKERQGLIKRAEAHISKRLPETEFALDVFAWADRITNLCEIIASDFCFGEATEFSGLVCARVKSEDVTEIIYTLDDDTITVRPWPFCVERYRGFIVGYQSEGYPDRLEPEILPWRFIPGRAS